MGDMYLCDYLQSESEQAIVPENKERFEIGFECFKERWENY